MPPSRHAPISSQLEQGAARASGNGGPWYASFQEPPFQESPAIPGKAQAVTRSRCNWPGCQKTFTRTPDLVRHHNSVHLLVERFWCTFPGCNRSENYPGQTRPFPRKDKLDSHVRNIHRATVPTSSSLTLAAAQTPRAGGLTTIGDSNPVSGFTNLWSPNLDGFANTNRPNYLDGLTSTSGPFGLDVFARVNSLSGAGGFISDDGFNSADSYAGIRDLNTVGRSNNVDGLTGIDDFTNANGPTGIDGSAGANEFRSADEFNNTSALTGVEGLDCNYGTATMEGLTYVNGLTDANELNGTHPFFGTDGPMGINGVNSADGLGNVDAFMRGEGSTDVGGVTYGDEFMSIDGFYGVDGFSNVDGLGNVEEFGLTGVDNFNFSNGFADM